MMTDAVNQILQGLDQGLVSQGDVENLNKAITAGYGGAGKPTDLTYGGVLQAESLEATLKSVTFDMKNLKLWPAISVDKAYNLFEQYNRLISYGSDSAPYIGEGGAPLEEDSTYVRDGQKIVFFGTRRKVSHQMTLVRTTVGDIVAQQAKEGTMNLLKNVEREMYWGHGHFLGRLDGSNAGDDSALPSNSIAMSGILKQLKKGDADVLMRSGDFEGFGDAQSIAQDLGGNVIAQDDVERLAVIALENFGAPHDLHIEPAALSAFVKQFYPQFRSAPGLSNQTVGYDVSKMVTTAGTIDFKPNLFLRPRAGARSLAVSAQAPSLGSLGVAGIGAGSGSAYAAGAYKVKITLVNDAGESIPFQATEATPGDLTITAGQNIDLSITNMPAGVKYIKVYISAAGGAVGSEKFAGNFANQGNVAYRLAGRKQAGLGEAFLLDLSAECMKFKQLAPLSKINFAIVTTALEFAIVMYGALFVYTPRFNCLFENVGK
jgi:hypothetical protein